MCYTCLPNIEHLESDQTFEMVQVVVADFRRTQRECLEVDQIPQVGQTASVQVRVGQAQVPKVGETSNMSQALIINVRAP